MQWYQKSRSHDHYNDEHASHAYWATGWQCLMVMSAPVVVYNPVMVSLPQTCYEKHGSRLPKGTGIYYNLLTQRSLRQQASVLPQSDNPKKPADLYILPSLVQDLRQEYYGGQVDSKSPASELGIHVVSCRSHAGVDVNTHVGEGRLELWLGQVQRLQHLAANRQQGLFRPGAEPVNCAAINERGELAAAGPEDVPRAHRQHTVQIVPHPIYKRSPTCFLQMCKVVCLWWSLL